MRRLKNENTHIYFSTRFATKYLKKNFIKFSIKSYYDDFGE